MAPCASAVNGTSSLNVGARPTTTNSAGSSARSSTSSSTSVSTCTEKSLAAQTAKPKKSNQSRRHSKNEPNTTSARHEMSSAQRDTKTLSARKTGATATASSDSVGNSPTPRAQHIRKATPNKWETVMSKIAHNKAVAGVHPKNYSDVKSKVTSGLKRSSPILRNNNQPNLCPDQIQTVHGSQSENECSPLCETNALPLSRQTTYGVLGKRLAI